MQFNFLFEYLKPVKEVPFQPRSKEPVTGGLAELNRETLIALISLKILQRAFKIIKTFFVENILCIQCTPSGWNDLSSFKIVPLRDQSTKRELVNFVNYARQL